jgi:hypothetical protein
MSKLVVAAERGVVDSWPIIRKIAVHAVLFTDGEIAVRGPISGGVTGPVEEQAVAIAKAVSATPAIYVPIPSDDARAGVFHRDYKLVEGAELILAFFREGSDMGGGTGHVVKAAIDREVAVDAFSVSEDGDIEPLFADGGWREREGALL